MVNAFTLDKIEKEQKQSSQSCKTITAISNNPKPLVLFGAGEVGINYMKSIQKNFGISLIFCDNNPAKWGTTVEGISVISFDELKSKYYNSNIVITTGEYYDEIRQQLARVKLDKNVLDVFDYLLISNKYDNYYSLINENIDKFHEVYNSICDEYSKNIFYDRINYCITRSNRYLIPLKSKSAQYFDAEIISLLEDEVFVDGGAYTGDTVDEFIKQSKGRFKKIYSFEPEKSKHNEFLKKFSDMKNIELIQCGLWSEEGVHRFMSLNKGGSRISDDGNIEVPVVSIDRVLHRVPVTFIKMDIEGAELEALKGAKSCIMKYKPKLAICVYHKPLDIIEIPLYLKTIVPEYKIYFRHYSNTINGTICYAVVD